ncbi:hypothetical protein KDK_33160 [Dictyobacter kobayashii]|uniref:Uncharacterized protein n=1 Tax=Dictyobacter kobayashii TaxID=2014872 RepID=A0A402AK67_9CHLR|nr:hypothetical protein KDK_33160 [Dictyobacter kobayashii]
MLVGTLTLTHKNTPVESDTIAPWSLYDTNGEIRNANNDPLLASCFFEIYNYTL